MNFKNHKKELRAFFKEQKIGGKTYGARGVYVFTRDLDDDVFKLGVSYGRAGLYNRLKNYQICYPFKNEFFLHMVVITPTGEDGKKLERQLLRNKTMKSSPSLIAGTEFRITSTRKKLFAAVEYVLEGQPDLWTHVVVFNGDCWKVIPNRYPRSLNISRPPARRCRGKASNFLQP